MFAILTLNKFFSATVKLCKNADLGSERLGDFKLVINSWETCLNLPYPSNFSLLLVLRFPRYLLPLNHNIYARAIRLGWFRDLSNLSIYLSLYLIIYPFIYPSIWSSIHLSIHLSDHLSIYLSIYLIIYPFIWSYIHLSIHLSDHISIYLSIYLIIYPFIYTSI